MDPRQILLVQRSFARASRIGPLVAATFYAELFAIEPALRAMFKSDMIVQSRKLWEMLSHIVARLDDPDTILPTVRELAVRHVKYGVQARHYKVVGLALLRTLRHELGADFTAETSAAWSEAYQFLSAVMCEAAYGAAPPAR